MVKRLYYVSSYANGNMAENDKKIKGKWGKKAAKQIPSYLAMLVVWLMFGLWHGGDWKFILGEGMFCYLCILLAKLFEPLFKK